MLCALLLGLPSPAAKAITRSENRVGGSPVFSSDFASQETANPIGTRAENPGCGYDFASGVHKYLYVGDNPVNQIDPSGQDFTLGSFSVTAGGAITIEGFALPATTRAFSWAAFRVITAAIAIGAEIGGDRGGSQMLFHYDTLPEFQATGFPTGTWLTDRGDLPFDQALSITFQSGSRLFVYAVAIKSPSEIEPFPPLRPGVNQWRTTVYMPPVRIGIFRKLYGPNWTGPTE